MNNLITNTAWNDNEGILIDSEKSKKWLLDSVSSSTKTVDFCSAFITVGSLRFFYESFLNNGFTGSVRLLARWQLTDLLSGASDTESYEYAVSNGIQFYVNLNFHGKIYSVKSGGILIGSANLTSAGFALKQDKNDEVCVSVQDNEENSKFIDNLFSNATEIDRTKFTFIKSALDKIMLDSPTNDFNDWPDNVVRLLAVESKVEKLLVDEMFHTKYSEILSIDDDSLGKIHDLSLLGLKKENIAQSSVVKEKFLKSQSFLWMYQKLKDRGGEVYFGELAALLHAELLDDPIPYRKDVKVLIQNLLDWTENFAGSLIVIDRPNYSQRITLKNT